MTDQELIERLLGWAKDIHEGSTAVWAMDQDLKEAADRIEELGRQRDGWEETALMYAQNVDFWKSKLAKAVEALRGWDTAVLAELEGKE